MEIRKLFIPEKHPYKNVWKKQKKSIIAVLSFAGLASFVFAILRYLYSEKNYFTDLKLKSLNIIDIYLIFIGVILVILIIIFILTPFVFKPFFLIINDIYKKNKYYNSLVKLLDSELKSGCTINIPKLNLKIKGSYYIDFHNMNKFFKEASFIVNEIKGNNWRIGIKLLDINRNEKVVFHPYINNPDQNYLSFRILNKENEVDKYYDDPDIYPSKPFKYKIKFSNNLINFFINDQPIKEIDGIPINENNFHLIRFHVWGNYNNSDISLELSNLLIIWA